MCAAVAACLLAAATGGAPAADARPAGRDAVTPGPVPRRSHEPPRDPRVAEFVAVARRQSGDAYASGATGPDAFDCSGLVVFAARAAGVDGLPRTSFALHDRGEPVSRDDVREGDLVFFDTAGPGASHVGIAVDGDRVVSATSSGVMVHAIGDEYWGAHYLGARRVLR